MTRLLMLGVLVAGVLVLPASHLVWGKGHVPVEKVQVCHKGMTITVAAGSLSDHLDHGDCQLPACDFNNIFHNQEDCSGVGPADSQGHCTGLEPRDDASGVTPGCPPGTF